MSLNPQGLSALLFEFFTAHQDAPAGEVRALQQICTALQQGSFKLALQHISKAVKLQKNSELIPVVKALALSHGSRTHTTLQKDEVVSVAETYIKLLGSAEAEDPTRLEMLTWSLTAIGRDEKASEMNYAAMKSPGAREATWRQSFLFFAKHNAYAKAHEAARLAYDQDKTEQNRCSVILMLILQLRHALEESKRQSLTDEAEQLVSTAEGVASSSQSQQTFWVEGKALQASATSGKASAKEKQRLLAHFASEQAAVLCERDLGLEIWRREVEMESGGPEEHEKLWRRLKKGVEDGDTNWHTMLFLIRSAFSLEEQDPSSSYVADTRQVFQAILDSNTDKSKKERGYLLALLEISSRRSAEKEQLKELCLRYFDVFGTKACCFHDLVRFLVVLEPSQASAFRDVVDKAAAEGDLSGSESENLRACQKRINAFKFQVLLSAPNQVDPDLVATLLAGYKANLPLGAALPATELQPADDFAFLAAQLLAAKALKATDRADLVRAAAVLETILDTARYKYQARILLINVYRLLAAPNLALAHYRQLEVKQIQYDTLAHLVLSRGATFSPSSGKDGGLTIDAGLTNSWYRTGLNEARSMPQRALSQDNYSQVEDFIVFQERLSGSLARRLTALELLRMRVLANGPGGVDYDELDDLVDFLATQSDLPELSDNRDYDTLPSYLPAGSASIWSLVELGPRLQSPWLETLSALYVALLRPSSDDTSPAAPEPAAANFTPSELAAITILRRAPAILLGTEPEDALKDYFKSAEEELRQLIDEQHESEPASWRVVHAASIAFEVYCLLDLGIDALIDELSSKKSKDGPKHVKRLKTLRNTAREWVRPVGGKMNGLAKTLGKEKAKLIDAVAPVQAALGISEARVAKFAQELVDSRKSVAEGMSSAIAKRCSAR